MECPICCERLKEYNNSLDRVYCVQCNEDFYVKKKDGKIIIEKANK